MGRRNERAIGCEFANLAGGVGRVPSYFEYQERRTQGAIAFDLIDFPDIVVTESELPEIPLIEDGERHAEGTK